MDPRGYATDPNADLTQPAKWWDDLGSTLGPQPYEDKDWVYLQDFVVEESLELAPGTPAVFDNGDNFNFSILATTFDNGLVTNPKPPALTLNEGWFLPVAPGKRYIEVKETLARIFVYDSLASRPTKGLISNVEVNGQPATFLNDTIPGTSLGSLNYTLKTNKVEITEWEHYGWYNSEPVVKAFQSMMVSIPKSVKTIEVPNAPDAFWIAQGFRRDTKGTLVLDLARPMPKYSSY